jgi:hypothetical protein
VLVYANYVCLSCREAPENSQKDLKKLGSKGPYLGCSGPYRTGPVVHRTGSHHQAEFAGAWNLGTRWPGVTP